MDLVDSYVIDATVVAKWFNRGEEFEKESDRLRTARVNEKSNSRLPPIFNSR